MGIRQAITGFRAATWLLPLLEVAFLIGLITSRVYASSEIEIEFLLGTLLAFCTVFFILSSLDVVLFTLRRLFGLRVPYALDAVVATLKFSAWLLLVFGLKSYLWSYLWAYIPLRAWTWWGTEFCEFALGAILFLSMARTWLLATTRGQRKGFEETERLLDEGSPEETTPFIAPTEETALIQR